MPPFSLGLRPICRCGWRLVRQEDKARQLKLFVNTVNWLSVTEYLQSGSNFFRTFFCKRFCKFREDGYAVIDSSCNPVPRLRNAREENQIIREGSCCGPANRTEKRNKDIYARWNEKRQS